jgi:hypothetical protein
VNFNTMPLTYNRLGDRVIKSPTPEQEVENPLALAAWKARANMAIGPAIQPSPELKPVGLFSSMSCGPSCDENTAMDENPELPEGRDEHMRFYD